MITQDQELQVEAYLRSRKLYHDLYIEIKDHFLSQISDRMAAHNIGFQEAFLKTKSDWTKELEMVRADFFSFKKIARIEKQVLQKTFRKIIFSSLICSLILTGLFFINEEVFVVLQIILLGGWISLLGYGFITKRIVFSNYIALSFHPLIIRNMLLSAVYFFLIKFLTVDVITLKDMDLNRFFFLYAMIVQLQIIYFKTKKINVLI